MFHERRRILINSGSSMTIETTSTDSAWSPQFVENMGGTLIWEVSGGATIPSQMINDPTFDFSSNTGTAIIEAEDITPLKSLTINSLDVTDLNVAEAVNLVTFICRFNNLTSLNVSNNVDLALLNCRGNDLAVLDFSNNINLTSLDCEANDLTSLDVSNNINLETLICRFNDLTSLDVSNNTLLNYLDCNTNDLTSLDVSNNVNLASLICRSTNITSLDVSNNILLTRLDARNLTLTPTNLDDIIIDLDNHGLSDGALRIPTGRTVLSDTAHANLITKNWTITES